MKKINYLLVLIMMITLIMSCSKDNPSDDETVFTKAYVLTYESAPISDGLVIPAILAPDKPKGGNITCADVADAFNTTFVRCGAKLNYGDFDSDGDFEFDGEFDGVQVTVDEGTYVNFTIKNLPGECFRVGAVIVKGGNSANVYYYPEGTLGDGGLAAPINRSGSPAGLSNLTFCFVECNEPEPQIITVKTYFKVNDGAGYCVSSGRVVFMEGAWCASWLWGVNEYPFSKTIDMHAPGTAQKLGEVNMVDGKIIVKLNEGLTIDNTYLFIGTEAELLASLSGGCPTYWLTIGTGWMFDDTDGNIQIFDPTLND
jgi:hypothetical protein